MELNTSKYTCVFFLAFFIVLAYTSSYSQNRASANILTEPIFGYKCKAIVFENDTFPEIDLNTIYITTDYIFKN